MTNKTILAAVAVASLGMAAHAAEQAFDGLHDSNPNAVNYDSALGGKTIVHYLQDKSTGTEGGIPVLAADQVWLTSKGQTATESLMFEYAGAAPNNIFGIYDAAATTPTLVQIFPGKDSAGATKYVSFEALATGWGVFVSSTSGEKGTQMATFSSPWFGYYLDSTGYSKANTGVWYSQEGKNTDKIDHFLTYQLTDKSYVIGMEDLKESASDKDYNDMVVRVQNVTGYNKIPDGGTTMMMLGFAMMGLGAVRARFRKA